MIEIRFGKWASKAQGRVHSSRVFYRGRWTPLVRTRRELSPITAARAKVWQAVFGIALVLTLALAFAPAFLH